MSDKPKEIEDLGCANGWASNPPIVDVCVTLRHPREVKSVARSIEKITCKICGYTYTVDSSD